MLGEIVRLRCVSFYALVIVLLSACGMVTERSVYEGIRAQQKMRSEGHVTKQLPDYDTFSKEREEISPRR